VGELSVLDGNFFYLDHLGQAYDHIVLASRAVPRSALSWPAVNMNPVPRAEGESGWHDRERSSAPQSGVPVG